MGGNIERTSWDIVRFYAFGGCASPPFSSPPLGSLSQRATKDWEHAWEKREKHGRMGNAVGKRHSYSVQGTEKIVVPSRHITRKYVYRAKNAELTTFWGPESSVWATFAGQLVWLLLHFNPPEDDLQIIPTLPARSLNGPAINALLLCLVLSSTIWEVKGVRSGECFTIAFRV